VNAPTAIDRLRHAAVEKTDRRRILLSHANPKDNKGIDYDREVGRVKVSTKEVVPDFILPKLSLALKINFQRPKASPAPLVDEINADILSYGKSYRQMQFVVYDLGTIRDVLEFTRDLEAVDGVEVIVIKH
jgi:hypothetical protein